MLDASDVVLHQPGAIGAETLAGALGLDLESQLQRIYERARSVEEVEAELATLRDDMEGKRREFEATHQRTAGLIESRLDETVRAGFAELRDQLPQGLADFDQDMSLLFDGRAADFGEAELASLYSRRALGASDLASALRRASTITGPSGRVVLMTDGVATAGEQTAQVLAAAKDLERVGVVRLDAIVDGGLQDRDTLEAIQTAHGADIVFLTAMPPRHHARRRALLDRHGFAHPMIATEDAKGDAVAALTRHHPQKPVAFIDDLPPNHVSVLRAAPGALGLHLMAFEGLRPHLPAMPEGVKSVRDWPEAAAEIADFLAKRGH